VDPREVLVCAEALVAARRGRLIEALPLSPASIADAHAIQDCQAVLLGWEVGGFKVHVAPARGTTRGLIFQRLIHYSPARISRRDAAHFGVEGEIAFRFLRDFPERRAVYEPDEVAEAVAVLPVIEVVSGRYRRPDARPFLEQLADCMVNAAIVLGDSLVDWT
jgi:2-keto-4-pentenoate hydratase